MIEVKHVVKSFDGFHALDGLTMTVPQGAIYGLVGQTGRASPPFCAIWPGYTGRTRGRSCSTGRRCTKIRR